MKKEESTAQSFKTHLNKTEISKGLTFEKLEKLYENNNVDSSIVFEPIIRDYSINNFNGNPGLSQWGYENPYVSKNKFQLEKYVPYCLLN
jgi:hypothetical protein